MAHHAPRRAALLTLLLAAHALATPLLLYHSLEELSESAFHALPSTAGIHWVLGQKNQRIAADKAPLLHRRDSSDACATRGQLFAPLARTGSSAIVAVMVVLVLANVPITAFLSLAVRGLGRQRAEDADESREDDGSVLAVDGGDLFAERRLRALRDEKAALTWSSTETGSSSDESIQSVEARQSRWSQVVHSAVSLLKQAAVFISISLLYLCCWAAVILAPFSIGAFTLCRVGYEPSSSLLAGLWTLYGICDVGLMLIVTCYLTHIIRKVLASERNDDQAFAGKRQPRFWPGRARRLSLPHTPDSQRTLLRRKADIYTRRPSTSTKHVQPAPCLPTVRSDASTAFSNPDALLRTAARPPTRPRTASSTAAGASPRPPPPEHAILAILRNPHTLLAATRSRLSLSSSFRGRARSEASRPGSAATAQIQQASAGDVPPVPERAASPAPSSYYGPRKSLVTLRSFAGGREEVAEAWREFVADGAGGSPYERE